jgi:hypothetical protein
MGTHFFILKLIQSVILNNLNMGFKIELQGIFSKFPQAVLCGAECQLECQHTHFIIVMNTKGSEI